MKKIVVILLLACAVCGGSFAQEKAAGLEKAITSVSVSVMRNIPKNKKVAIYGCNIPDSVIEDKKNKLYQDVLDDIIVAFSREKAKKQFIIVDRQELETVRVEMNFQLSGEVPDDKAKALGRKLEADYIVTGRITRSGDGSYKIYLKIIDVESGEIITMDSAAIIKNDIKLSFFFPSDEKSFVISVGGRAGVSPHFFKLSGDISGSAKNPSPGFEPAVHTAFCFTDFFALQTELALSRDKVSYSGVDPADGAYTASFESYSLRIPLLARFTYSNPDKLGGFSFGGFAGIGFNIPLGDMKLHNSLYNDSSYRFLIPPGYVAGVNAGWRFGGSLRHMLFTDIRFSGDFLKTVIKDSSGTLALYLRNTLSFSVGYEFIIRN